MSPRRDADEALHAYYDGELSRFARWRVKRRIARDPDARREFERWSRIGALLRESEAEAPAPDLWAGIEGRLRAVDATLEVPESVRRPWFASAAGLLRPAAAVAVVAGVAVAAALFFTSGPPPHPSVVRWLDTMGQPVMVLEQEDDATIIWLMDSGGDHVSRGRDHAVI
jgi:anti-sigma-K factor RskA